jgi:hypothetical protein
LKVFRIAFAMRLTILTAAILGFVAALPPTGARGSHHGRFAHPHGISGDTDRGSRSGRAFARNQRHGDDDYVKAAAAEEDKLLDTKIKSICHGC